MSFTSSVETREAGSGVAFTPECVSKAAAEVREGDGAGCGSATVMVIVVKKMK
jgi:hypothetical protein